MCFTDLMQRKKKIRLTTNQPTNNPTKTKPAEEPSSSRWFHVCVTQDEAKHPVTPVKITLVFGAQSETPRYFMRFTKRRMPGRKGSACGDTVVCVVLCQCHFNAHLEL